MRTRPAGLLVALVATVACLLLVRVPSDANGAPGSCGKPEGCTDFELQHAGSTFGWYPETKRYEFKEPDGKIPAVWSHQGKGMFKELNGMLGLYADQGGSVSTTWSYAARTGRWETRIKLDRMATGPQGTTDYTTTIALVPQKPTDAHCGAQGITLLKYRPAQPDVAKFAIKTLPANVYGKSLTTPRPVGGAQWHTWAVEVTPKRISWYVDAAVVAREVRPAALLDVPLKLKVTLTAVPGATMQSAKAQLDWARYWTLAKPGKNQDLVAKAPLTGRSTNPTAC
ncbi:MAG: hypothetical protein JWQ74_1709 [Marmoricola sp.]|nr:hypothetical protein [Marmoricola sp.]